jgi:hypothetical protein
MRWWWWRGLTIYVPERRLASHWHVTLTHHFLFLDVPEWAPQNKLIIGNLVPLVGILSTVILVFTWQSRKNIALTYSHLVELGRNDLQFRGIVAVAGVARPRARAQLQHIEGREPRQGKDR